MTPIVGAYHEFHDPAYAADWAARFAPTPGRLALFDLMLSTLRDRVAPTGRIVELGIGPGYLAGRLLDALPAVRYRGVDFSRPMLDIAARRLRPHAGRVGFLHADLLADAWWRDLDGPVDAVVSTWALHDLGAPARVEHVYAACARVLRSGGPLLNGDFIKPAGAAHEYEPGRFEVATHLDLLRRVGFEAAECLRVFEEEIEAPTPAQNYACFLASRRSWRARAASVDGPPPTGDDAQGGGRRRPPPVAGALRERERGPPGRRENRKQAGDDEPCDDR